MSQRCIIGGCRSQRVIAKGQEERFPARRFSGRERVAGSRSEQLSAYPCPPEPVISAAAIVGRALFRRGGGRMEQRLAIEFTGADRRFAFRRREPVGETVGTHLLGL